MRTYDMLELGERRHSDEWQLDESQIIAFGRQFDPQYFHVDPIAARASPFGMLIASGMHLLAIARALDHAMNGEIAYICGVAFEDVRFLRPGLPGDRLSLSSEIVMLRPSEKDAGRGIVGHDYLLMRDGGEPVLAYRSVSLVRRA
ncbi:dehydratase [Sphingomonas sp. CGMCC 1.13654]|uniref:Dehydratase n=2 Tax=Sphingomonas chungangi TaxID=2683589 RepID=A0A838L3L2_9SPHN|nr:dehydratase [Sphingomonas chungangi]MVW54979.1 dehydratase [Sphingomonas chungangi]